MPTNPDLMHALVQPSFGGPRELALRPDVRRPTPGPHDYLVRVVAAGVNFADVLQSEGRYGGGPQPPYVAGFEAAGEIVAVGAAIEHPVPLGTLVIGTGPGAFAEFMTMPAATALPVPSGWPAAHALGFVLNWATALAALRPLGQVAAGEVVLIHSAAGGVGQAAVRLASHYGARVVATASAAKLETVRALGAEVVLDRARPDLLDEINRRVGGVDVVLESVGRATLPISLAAAKAVTGRIIVFGAASGDAAVTMDDLVYRYPVQLKGLHIGTLAAAEPATYRSLLDELQELVRQGVYAPAPPQLHPLADGPRVLELLAAGRTQGKHGLEPGR